MSEKTIKNVFISHVHEDDAKLQDLKNLLGKHGCEVRDASIDSSNPNNAKDPDYIMNRYLKPGIDWAGATIVLISPDTHTSEWVNREIEYAHDKEKRIIGVWCQGAKDSDLPEMFEKYGDDLVGWQGEKIIDSLNGIDHWDSPGGTPRPPQNTPRYGC